MSYHLDDILSDLQADGLAPLPDLDLMSGIVSDADPLLDDSFVQQIIGEYDSFVPSMLDSSGPAIPTSVHQAAELGLYQQQQQHQPELKSEPAQRFNVLETLLRNPAPGPVVTPAPPAVLTAASTVSSSTAAGVSQSSVASVTATDKLIALLLQQREDATRRENLINRLVRQVCQEQQQRRPGSVQQPPVAEELAAAFRELSTAQLEQLASGSLQIMLPNAQHTVVPSTAAAAALTTAASSIIVSHPQLPQPPAVSTSMFKVERLSPALSTASPTLPTQPAQQQQQQQPPVMISTSSLSSRKENLSISASASAGPAFDEFNDEDLDDEDEDGDGGMPMDQDAGTGGGTAGRRSGGGGVGRKSSHTVIEKKYRQSINNKIDELRRMLVGRDGKLSKSLVLKRTIDRIHHLERENESLRRQLGKTAGSGGGFYMRERDSSVSGGGLSPGAFEDVVSGSGNGSDSPTSLPSPCGGGSSVGSTLVQLLQQSGVAAQSAQFQQQQQLSTAVRCTMMLTACCFLFLLNPLQLGANWLSGVSPGISGGISGGGGRSLKSVDSVVGGIDGAGSSWWWLSTLANCAILLFLGCRYSPLPSTVRRCEHPKKHAARLLAFERCCRLADDDIRAGSWERAWSRLRTCLVLLHRPLPVSALDWAAQIVWHLALAACLQVCSLLPLSLPVSEQQRQLAALAALTYSRLLQLQLSVGDSNANSNMDLWHLRALLLNCSNFLGLAGPTADAALPVNERIRLLATMGIAARRVGLPSVLAARFYRRAARLASTCGSEAWLATPQGAAFLAEYRPGGPLPQSHRTDDTVYSTPGCAARPLDRARSVFAESLLEAAMEDLVLAAPSAASCIGKTTGLCQSLFSAIDPAASWWAGLARLAAAWRSDDGGAASAAPLSPLPAGLLSDRLAASLTLAASAHRAAVVGSPAPASDRPDEAVISSTSLESAETAANMASAGLRELLTADRLGGGGQQQQLRWMTQAWCLVGLDWLLSARTVIAQQQPGISADSRRHQLSAFQSDLRLVRESVQRIGADPRRWLAAHEAALRLLCGANPISAGCCLRQAEAAGASSDSAAMPAERKVRLVKQLLNWQQRLTMQQAGLDR